MAGCDNFVEQLWRKGKCANCFQPKEKHLQNTLENIGEETSVISNYRAKYAVTQSPNQTNSHFKAAKVSSAESTDNSVSKELIQNKNGTTITITPSTHATKSANDHGFTTYVDKTSRDSKVLEVNKPKPAPRTKSRPFSRVGESTVCDKSRDENPQESSLDVLNVVKPLENSKSLGKSHEQPDCNASFLERAEEAGLSIQASDYVLDDTTGEGNIETVCETIVSEELEKDAKDSNDNMNLEEHTDNNDCLCVSENVEPELVETDLLKIEIVDSDSDTDEYVPMKNNIALFVAESTAVQNDSMTDVLDVVRDNMVEDEIPANQDHNEEAAISCDSRSEEDSSSVLEFKNPLFKITDDMGTSQSSTPQGSGVERGKLNPTSKTEPFYENRPASLGSETGSSQDSGYENIRKSTRSDSSNSASGNTTEKDSDVKTVEPVTEGISTNETLPVVFSDPSEDSSIESSGTSCSSWGSSTWDSCSMSDFPENSGESRKALPVKTGAGLLVAKNQGDKPRGEVLAVKAKRKQSNPDMENSNQGPAYMNAEVKAGARPYKVVDISTGMLVPPSENPNNAPPLPPKVKALKKDKPDVMEHEYLEPREDTKGVPEQAPPAPPKVNYKALKKDMPDVMEHEYLEPLEDIKGVPEHAPPAPPKIKAFKKDKPDEMDHEYLEPREDLKGIPEQAPPAPPKGPAPIPETESVPGPLSDTAPSTILDKSTPIRRAPAPRPRSRVPSQCGTLPKPAPRMSRVLSEAPVKVDSDGEKNEKAVTQSTVTTKPLDDIHPPNPPSLSRLPSLKKSSPASVPSSPPASPRKSTFYCETSESPSENVPLSPAHDADGAVGENQEGPIRPKRSAPPPPPPSASSPPPKSPTPQPVEASPSPSPAKAKSSRSSSFSGPHNTSPSPNMSSPKSTIRRAFATMKKFGSKKKSKRSKTIEISGPIAVNDEVPGFLVQKEEVRKRALSEGIALPGDRASTVEPVKSKTVEPCASAVVAPLSNSSVSTPSPTGSASVGSSPINGRSSGTSSPIMQTKPGMGYQNFPLSRGGDTLERPKKPPRQAKLVKPLQHNPPAPDETVKQADEEPTYLQPNEDELTRKVEVALANLNDAEILAEALSRVEQEKLGPLPAIPRSRHVHFQCERSGDNVTRSPLGKPQLPKRPVRVVSPTLINGSGDKGGESKSRPPKLPSRPPNTKPSLQAMRERSRSLEGRVTGHAGVVRSRSLSSPSNVLEKRYNKILKLQMQTLEEMISSWKEELLPDAELDLSDTRWSDYQVCGDVLDVPCGGAVLVPVKCAKFWEGNKKLLAKVQYPIPSSSRILQRSPFKQDMRVCEALPHHVSISRVLTHFTDDVSGDAIGEPDCDSYETSVSISDQMPCETVADFLRRTTEEHENDPETYEKKVCLLLLQLLSALDQLQREAVVHRDLKADNLFLLDCGLLVVANFEHALHQDKNTQPSPFILSASVSSHLGGNLEHLPPEILNAPEDADTLSYEECDSFAAGCLVYEFLHRPNPFAVNPNLVQQKYTGSDLPPLPVKSRFSRGLGMIARNLLLRHPQERMSAAEAIQMLQVLLWGPEDLEDDDLESAIGDWLETERAHTVAMIARNQRSCSSDEFMEIYMKCQFLVDGTEDTITYNYQHLVLHK